MKMRPMGAIDASAPLQVPGQVVASEFQWDDSFLAGLITGELGIAEAFDKLEIAEARWNSEIELFQIHSFQYHFNQARGWAEQVRTDPRGVVQQIQAWFQDSLFSQTDPAKIEQWFLGNYPIAGYGLGGMMVATQMYYSSGAATGAAVVKAAQTASPYGGDAFYANLDYLAFPLIEIVSLCATDPQATQNMMSIALSDEMLSIAKQIDAMAVIAGNQSIAVDVGTAYWNALSPTQQSNAVSNAATQWLGSIFHLFQSFFDDSIGYWSGALKGPAFILPYDSNNPPTPSPARDVAVSQLKGSQKWIDYFDSYPFQIQNQNNPFPQSIPDWGSVQPMPVAPLPKYSQAELASQAASAAAAADANPQVSSLSATGTASKKSNAIWIGLALAAGAFVFIRSRE